MSSDGYPAAITAGTENRAQAVELGAAWVLERLGDVGGEVLLQVPNKIALAEMADLAATPGVVVSVGRKPVTWRGGPVLLVHAMRDDYAELISSRSDTIRALCIIPWHSTDYLQEWVTGWVMRTNAERLGDVVLADLNWILDPVARVGLAHLAGRADDGVKIRGELGRCQIKCTLKILGDARFALPPAQVDAFLIASGASPQTAEAARDYAESISAGAKLRWPDIRAVGPDALDRWHAEA